MNISGNFNHQQSAEENLQSPEQSPLQISALELLAMLESFRIKILLLLPEKTSDNHAGSGMVKSFVPQPQGEKATPIFHPDKAFPTFMVELQKANPSHTINSIIQQDESMPIADVISDGLWIVMLKLSQKYQLHLATEKEVTDKMGILVNNLVNMGLFATYGENIAAAAQDFQKEVVLKVEQNLKNQPLNKPLNPEELWQVASAQFFAKLINNAREKIRKNIEMAMMLEKENSVENSHDLKYISGTRNYEMIELLRIVQKYLENPKYDSPLTKDYPLVFSKSLEDNLEHYRERIQLYKLFPVRLEKLPRDVTIIVSYVDFQWMNSQIVVTVLGVDKEFSTGKDLTEASKILGLLSDEQVVEKAMDMWKKRGMKIDEVSEEKILKIVELSVQTVRMNLVTRANKNVAESDQVTALFLFQDAGELQHELENEGEKERDMNWPAMEIDELCDLIYSETHSMKSIAEGIVKMNATLQPEAVETFLGYKLDAEAFKVLCKHSLVSINNPKVYSKHFLLPPNWVVEHIVELKNSTGSDSDKFLPKIILALPKKKVSELFKNPEFIFLIYNIVLMEEMIDLQDVEKIKKLVGAKLWTELELKSALIDRQDEYENLKTKQKVPQWESVEFASEMAKKLKITPKKAQKVLQDNPEDEVFLKVYSDDEERDEMLRGYIQSRQKYYGCGTKK